MTVFPVNSNYPARIDFLGNKIEKIVVLKEAETAAPSQEQATREQRERSGRRMTARKESAHLHNLKPGAFVVHLDHGIGIYKGMENMQTTDGNPRTERAEQSSYDGETVNYYVLEYAPPKDGKDPDRLLVPENQAKKLSIYLGFETPKIHRLSGNIWEHTKKKATEDAQKLAVELLKYIQKRGRFRQAYDNDKHMQREFENIFDHLETDDQKKPLKKCMRIWKRQADGPVDLRRCRIRQNRSGYASLFQSRQFRKTSRHSLPDNNFSRSALRHIH